MASTEIEGEFTNGLSLKDEKKEMAASNAEFADLQYQRGFGNHFTSEVLKGALPLGQNSPLKCPYGLYAEQLSGTAFTVPRRSNQHRWPTYKFWEFQEFADCCIEELRKSREVLHSLITTQP
jgi:hypothetical protein